jgi:hypothetical protein
VVSGNWKATQLNLGGDDGPDVFISILALDDNDVWICGVGGLLVHWDGKGWSPVDSGVPNNLWALGGSANDLWAVGESATRIHYDGTSWTVDSSPCTGCLSNHLFRSVFPVAPNDVWAAGHTDVVDPVAALFHFDGSAWSAVPGTFGSALTAVGGSGADDVWAVGRDGTNAHFDGSAWSYFPTANRLASSWTAPAKDTWFAGRRSTIAHWDGTELSAMLGAAPDSNNPLSLLDLVSIAGDAQGNLWATASSEIIHFDGRLWSRSIDGRLVNQLAPKGFADAGLSAITVSPHHVFAVSQFTVMQMDR